MKGYRFVILALALLVMAGLVSCQSCAERVIEEAVERQTGEEVEIDIDGSGEGQITITTEDGQGVFQAGMQTRIPENFPDDVPIYEGAQPMVVVADPSGGIMVSLQTDADVSAVNDFYRRQMPARGWSSVTTFTGEGMTHLGWRKGERSASVNITTGDEESGAAITLSVTPPPSD